MDCLCTWQLYLPGTSTTWTIMKQIKIIKQTFLKINYIDNKYSQSLGSFSKLSKEIETQSQSLGYICPFSPPFLLPKFQTCPVNSPTQLPYFQSIWWWLGCWYKALSKEPLVRNSLLAPRGLILVPLNFGN